MSNKSFSYPNMLKGNITQTILKTLLEDVGYTVVPFGIEEVFREIKDMPFEQKHYIPTTLWKMPDFIVLDKEQKEVFMVEVKYRQCFDSKTFKDLETSLKQQLEFWNPIYLMLFSGDISGIKVKAASEVVRIARVDLIDGEPFIHYRRSLEKNPVDHCPWSKVDFSKLTFVQEVFTNLKEKTADKTILKMTPLIETLKFIERAKSQWADYCISAVRYDETDTYITHFEIHTDYGDRIDNQRVFTREEVMTGLLNKRMFVTIVFSEEENQWRQGYDLKLTLNGNKYEIDTHGIEDEFSLRNLKRF